MWIFKYWFALQACLLASGQVYAETKEWTFDVYLDNNKIGLHSFKLTSSNRMLSEANFQVDFLFVNAYRYAHISKEEWKNDCLTKLDATTKENKTLSNVSGHLVNGNFLVKSNPDTNEKNKLLPACVMTFAYWNPNIVNQTKLLNPQNGEYLSTHFKLIGDDKVEVKGALENAKRYQLIGNSSELEVDKPKLNILIWYDNKNEWVGLRSTTPEGYTIDYKRK